jgi:uncharacterized coiled-coil protein SlyX
MHKLTLIKLLVISTLFCAATAINTKAQTPDDASAKDSRKIQPVARDEACNQRLAKTLDALDAAETAIKTLQAALQAQKKLAEINDAVVAKKDEIIKSQNDLIKIYEKEKGITVSIFFGLVKIRKR